MGMSNTLLVLRRGTRGGAFGEPVIFDMRGQRDEQDGVPDSCQRSFIRGDCSGDGRVDLSDAVCTLNWLFLGAARPGCASAMNSNGDAAVDIADPISLLAHLFLGGPQPVAPYPACGRGGLALDAELGCVEPSAGCP